MQFSLTIGLQDKPHNWHSSYYKVESEKLLDKASKEK